MTIGWMIAGAVAALVAGVWVGLGAPGWPWQPRGRNSKLQKRPINPIAWGRTGRRERLEVKAPGERRTLDIRKRTR